jgi:uncharacterized protein (TIGR02145 family)
MAENLDYDVGGSKCYDNDPANCEQYGRLYNWSTAMSACPAGWHLPKDAEWTRLVKYVGGEKTAGKKLKSTSGWYNYGNGTDAYGFSALPGGLGSSGGNFDAAGYYGRWWSATGDNASFALYRLMYYDGGNVGRRSYDKSVLFSVRCVAD